MPKLKYLYPEYIKPWDQERNGDSQIDLPLTNVVSQESQRDVYNNPQYMTGENTAYGTGELADKLPLASPIDPGGYENPAAGGWYETGPSYCDTCQKTVFGQELALPTHLGHALRYGDAQQTIDIDNVHKIGGGYKLDWETRNDPTNPSGMKDGINKATTKPQLKAEKGEKEYPGGYSFIESPEEGDSSWRAKPLENYDSGLMKFDKGMIDPNANLINENTIIADDEDRTVPM